MARTSVQWGMDGARVGLVVSFLTQLGEACSCGLCTHVLCHLEAPCSSWFVECFFIMKKHLFLKQRAWEIWKENRHNLLAAGNRVIAARSTTVKSQPNSPKLRVASVKVIVRVSLQDRWAHRRRRFGAGQSCGYNCPFLRSGASQNEEGCCCHQSSDMRLRKCSLYS